jgi:hypothetical protein
LGCEALEVRDVPSVGYEFGVNTDTARAQFEPVNATSPDGTRSVVVWTSETSPGNTDIKAQVYDGNGGKIHGEFTVASSSKKEHSPSVAMDDKGNFVVVWTLDWSSTDRDIMGARFNPNGSRFWSFGLMTSTKSEYDPDVAVSPNGASIIVAFTFDWSDRDQDVYAWVFDSNANYRDAIAVDTSGLVEHNPSVARAGNNSFVVAYQKWSATGFSDIHVARYDFGNGTHGLVSRAQVDSPSRHDINPDVGVDDNDGAAVVVYQSLFSTWDIHGRRVGREGFVSDNEFIVAQSSTNETNPSLAMGPGSAGSGGAVVAYRSGGSVLLCEKPFHPSAAFGGFTLVLTGSSARGVGAPSVSVSSGGRYLVTYSYAYRSPYVYYQPGTPEIPDVYGRFGDAW